MYTNDGECSLCIIDKLMLKGLHFPYNLFLFADWWQHDQSKQIIKISNLKSTCLLGCNARDKVIWCLKILPVRLEDTTWTLILPLQKSPCGIMDISLASYKFSSLHRLTHNSLFSLFRTITACKLLMFAFGPLNSFLLESNTEKEDISSTREGQTFMNLCV